MNDLVSRLRHPRVVSRAAWRMAIEVRTKDVRAHVIAL
jgi:hypothetical protein